VLVKPASVIICFLMDMVPGSFLSTTKELPAKSNKHFDLLENSYVSLHIFQCYFCNISVKLTCDNPVVNKEVILGRDGNQMVCVYIISVIDM
jgi:hypothetical protein